MKLFDTIAEMGHEQLVICNDRSAGYRGIIAIHSTTLGPALGGTRFWQYASDDEAIVDALRLARGMTYKNAVAGLNLGGGKSVIIGNNRTVDREMIFRAHGRFVESLGGRYITAEDVGTSTADMASRIESARALLHATAAAKDRGESITRYGSMCKLLASETAMWVTTQAVQIFGGYGYVKEYPVEKLFRDAKITEIYEGTSEIQRVVIARELYASRSPN